MSDELIRLLKEKDRTAARVVGAAINAISFYEALDYDTAYRILKGAVEAHQQATRNYIDYLANSPARKENHGHRSAA